MNGQSCALFALQKPLCHEYKIPPKVPQCFNLNHADIAVGERCSLHSEHQELLQLRLFAPYWIRIPRANLIDI